MSSITVVAPARVRRVASGIALVVSTLASLGLMVTVLHSHLGFSPVLSASMEPAFRPGDLVVTRPEPAADIRVGQVVALPVPDAPGQRYVHRVISVATVHGHPLVRTKGDANPVPETFALRVTSDEVPVVVGSVPFIGRLSLVLQHGSLRMALVVLTVAFGGVATRRMVSTVRQPDPGTAGETP